MLLKNGVLFLISYSKWVMHKWIFIMQTTTNGVNGSYVFHYGPCLHITAIRCISERLWVNMYFCNQISDHCFTCSCTAVLLVIFSGMCYCDVTQVHIPSHFRGSIGCQVQAKACLGRLHVFAMSTAMAVERSVCYHQSRHIFATVCRLCQ